MLVKRHLSGPKAAILLLLAPIFALPAAPAAAQERIIELPVETMTAHDVIDAVQGQTDYLFTTNVNTRLDSLTVKVTRREMKVREVLDALLAGSGLRYLMSGSYIIIMPVTPRTTQQTTPRAEEDTKQ